MPEWTDVADDKNGTGAITKLQCVDHGKVRIYRIVTTDPSDGCQRVMAITAVKNPE